MALTVSALADQAGLSADTVRYYERVGLLPEPARSAAGYRLYDQTAIGRSPRSNPRVKAIDVPSGDHAGSNSRLGHDVTRTRPPPSEARIV